MKGNTTIPDQFQTYIDVAWEAHVAKMEELNAAIGVREWVNGIIAQHETELQAMAEQAS